MSTTHTHLAACPNYTAHIAEDKKRGENKQPHILIVDDEECILTSLSDILTMTFGNYSISTAKSAEQALDIMYDHSVDLIITDLKLPEMDGLELTKNVKSISPETESILITAFGNRAISDNAGKLGCLAYLEKPFDVDVLIHYASLALKRVSSQARESSPIGLFAMLQLYMQSGKDATLSVISGEHAGYLIIKESRIIHAQFAGKVGCEALLMLMDFPDVSVGPFRYKAPPKRTLSVSWPTIVAAMESDSAQTRLALLRGSISSIRDLPVYGSVSSVMRPVATPRSQQVGNLRNQTQSIDFDSYFKNQSNDFGQMQARSSNSATVKMMKQISPPLDLHTNVRVLVNAGITNFQAHRLDEAEKYWKKALELDEGCKEARNNLSVLAMVRKMKQTVH